MVAQDAESQALLAHIVAQVESNVQFLASHNYISQADASAFLAKLPSGSTHAAGNGPMNNLTSRFRNMVAPSGPPPPGARATPPAPAPAMPTPAMPTPAAGVPVKRAKALWAYNENGQDADDLSFSAGDLIEIVEETNADWWLGRVHGKEALFPSAYVEKLKEPPTPALGKSTTPYRPFGAALHGVDAPPPAGTNSVGLQQANQEKEKSKYGKLGNTMANSAASGVGFGAGAAIGGGLVRAIF